MKFTRTPFIPLIAFLGVFLLTQGLSADLTTYFEGFEEAAWTPGGNNWNNFDATISQVASGTNGVTSSDGSFHAEIGTTTPPNEAGPFTRFGGYSTEFQSGFTASLDIYLDPNAIGAGQGFDYSVAVNQQVDAHLRDFIFHVGNDGGSLLINASNNTDFQFNAFKLENENGGNNYTVTSAGWYTFEQAFRDDGGTLAVDFNVYNAGGSLVYTVTRATSDDIATEVGGNRYGWFTYNTVSNLAVDNSVLTYAVPEPTSSLACVLLLGSGLLVRRRK